eukprot:COSAG01_NODE_31448_length_597_cov_1.991968_1_plen_85_part_01
MLLLPLLLAGAARAGLQNGAAWFDTDGNQIEAHGGNILKIDGVYHWFGATKKELEYKGKPCVAECSLGINLYTSSDLMTWKFAAM